MAHGTWHFINKNNKKERGVEASNAPKILNMDIIEKTNQAKSFLRTINKDKYRIKTYCTKEDIENIISEQGNSIEWYRAIIHDKDVNENGEKKTDHCHIVLKLKDRKRASTIANWFEIKDEKGNNINTYIQTCDNVQGAIEYLTHKNHKDKYQYGENEIFGIGEIKGENQIYADIVTDICKGESEINIILKYGTEYTHYERNYHNIATRYGREYIKETIYARIFDKIRYNLIRGEYTEIEKLLEKVNEWNKILAKKEINVKAVLEQIKINLDE